MNKIYVGNLSYRTDQEGLSAHFSQFGAITEAVVITERGTGRSKGFGFVTFDSPEAAQAALALDGQDLDGRGLRVRIAEDKR